ncbi:hypothetical protein QBC46DRAFT_411121 [Diplogelasinospora grovesii]|uniref:(4-O-methyl)-D-glucuronate--lignin esterase n=1 Tax=Diplogelasinospora grovesii TaxID=303347 RepID=A0AAN6S1W6_9PEZI|nr:hypothetical protein QBC46DRAFT_411121 [Diplogelasinospora grovesii]
MSADGVLGFVEFVLGEKRIKQIEHFVFPNNSEIRLSDPALRLGFRTYSVSSANTFFYVIRWTRGPDRTGRYHCARCSEFYPSWNNIAADYTHNLSVAVSSADCDSANFNSYVNNVNQLPFDHHMLAALVSPRPLHIMENPDFEWLGKLSTYGCMDCYLISVVYFSACGRRS